MRLYDRWIVALALIGVVASLLYVPWMHKGESWVNVLTGATERNPPRPAGYGFISEPMNDGDFVNWRRVAIEAGMIVFVAVVAWKVNPKRSNGRLQNPV